MTSEEPVWEPLRASFAEQEGVMTDFMGQVISHETITSRRSIIKFLYYSEEDVIDFTDDRKLVDALRSGSIFR